MSIYTVHEPPLKAGVADPARFTFVRDGFHFWAFLLGPVWMIWRGLWLVFACYAAAAAAIGIAFYALNIRGGAAVLIAVLIALLVGVEASTLCRWTLRRRGWKEVAAVVGDDLESAERHFFSAWIAGSGPKPSAMQPSAPAMAAPSATRMPRGATPDVVGLFPEPGGSR